MIVVDECDEGQSPLCSPRCVFSAMPLVPDKDIAAMVSIPPFSANSPGYLPRGGRSAASVLAALTPARSGLIPHHAAPAPENSVHREGLAQFSTGLLRAPQICCKSLLQCN